MDADRERNQELYKQMSFKEKAAYILRYYWIRMVIGVVAVFVLVSIIGRLTWNRPKPMCLGVGVHTESINLDTIDLLEDKLNVTYASMTQEGKQKVYVYSFVAGTAGMSTMDNINILMKIVGAIEMKQLDVMLGDKNTLLSDCQQEYFMDLREIFSEEELKAIDEACKNRDPEEEGGVINVSYKILNDSGRTERYAENVPLLISIGGASADFDDVIVNEPVYLAVITNSPNIENTRQLIFSLLGLDF